MACVADVSRIGSAVSADWRHTEHSLRLGSARALHHVVIEVLSISPIVSLILSIFSTFIGCFPTQEEIDACIGFDHPMQTSVCQTAELCAVIESALCKVTRALASLNGELPVATINPFRLCAIATVTANNPCILDFHCSASLCFLALVRFCSLQNASQQSDNVQIAQGCIWGMMPPCIRWFRVIMSSAHVTKRPNITPSQGNSVYWIFALPISLLEDVIQARSFQPLAMLHHVNLFTTVTSALLKLGHWTRQGAFSEVQCNQDAALMAIRVTNVTFFEYLEEIVLYCYKKNTNLTGLSAQTSSASVGLGLLPPLCPNPFRVLGAMERNSMLLLLWPLLALWVAGASRRRARAVARTDLEAHEAPLEVIRLEDGTVLVIVLQVQIFIFHRKFSNLHDEKISAFSPGQALQELGKNFSCGHTCYGIIL